MTNRSDASALAGDAGKVATLTFVADTLTPVRAYAALRTAAGDAASFLLESVVGGRALGALPRSWATGRAAR